MRAHVITTPKRLERHVHMQSQLALMPGVEEVIHMHSMPPQHVRCERLFSTMCDAIRQEIDKPYCVIIEDDHLFTAAFSMEKLRVYIELAQDVEVDIMLGGVEHFTGGKILYRQSDPDFNLVRIENFVGTQFLVVFQRYYQRFLKGDGRCPEEILSTDGSARKVVVYPFLSYQEDLGSDFGRDYRRKQVFVEGEARMKELFNKKASNAVHVNT